MDDGMATREVAVIHDGPDFIEADWNYIRLGEREGWLKLDGWHRTGSGIESTLVYRYIHIRKD